MYDLENFVKPSCLTKHKTRLYSLLARLPAMLLYCLRSGQNTVGRFMRWTEQPLSFYTCPAFLTVATSEVAD